MQTGPMALSIKDDDACIMRAVFKLPSPLDAERLRAAWATVAMYTPRSLCTRLCYGHAYATDTLL